MCLAKLYEAGDSKTPVLENVTQLKIENGQVQVETLFGEKKVFPGKINWINFAESKIQIDKTP